MAYSSHPQRFWEKVEKADGCWLWTGGLLKGGYGQYSLERKCRQAHRLSYEMLVGRIPAGMVIDHLCREPRCVNPEHLEVVTRGENVARGGGPTAENARKTECRNGHPLAPGNLVPNKQGWRVCRACRANR
jgi:hypothetical protein